MTERGVYRTKDSGPKQGVFVTSPLIVFFAARRGWMKNVLRLSYVPAETRNKEKVENNKH